MEDGEENSGFVDVVIGEQEGEAVEADEELEFGGGICMVSFGTGGVELGEWI